jgi:hypothetical protein
MKKVRDYPSRPFFVVHSAVSWGVCEEGAGPKVPFLGMYKLYPHRGAYFCYNG